MQEVKNSKKDQAFVGRKNHVLWSPENIKKVKTIVSQYYFKNKSATAYLFPQVEDFIQSIFLDLFKQEGYLQYDSSKSSFKGFIWRICWRHAACKAHSVKKKEEHIGGAMFSLDTPLSDDSDFSLIDTLSYQDNPENVLGLTVENRLSSQLIKFINTIPEEPSKVMQNQTLRDIFVEYVKEDNSVSAIVDKNIAKVDPEQFEADIIDLLTSKLDESDDFQTDFLNVIKKYPVNEHFEFYFNILYSKVVLNHSFDKNFSAFKNKVFVNKKDLKLEILEIRDYLKFKLL